MQQLKILNTREIKEILRYLEKQFGITDKPKNTLLISEKGDVYTVDSAIKEIDYEKLRINTMGIYIGEFRNGEFRPSIEGSQIFGPLASKGILEVDKKLAKMWMYGLDIPCKEELKGWIIIKSGEDYMGSGRCKEGKILNHVPKGRRIHE